MEPIGTPASATTQRLRLSPRKVGVVAAALVVLIVVVAVVVVVVSRRSGPPGQDEVAAELQTAINEFAPGGQLTPDSRRFDTSALRARLEERLVGWNVDLAADSDGTRVGAAARQNEGQACVFAWSDVGASQSAVVNDPDLPCVAEIALIPAKNPA
ncbi:MAG: hypothetical protein ACKV2O_12120 [Acidimicrobiales bacterium]